MNTVPSDGPFGSNVYARACIRRLHHLPDGGLLQPCDLGHDGGGFFFEGGAHGLVIGIGDLAGFVFEIQVAQVLIDGFFALAEIAEARFFFSGVNFTGEKEDVVEGGEGEDGADEDDHTVLSSRLSVLSSDLNDAGRQNCSSKSVKG